MSPDADARMIQMAWCLYEPPSSWRDFYDLADADLCESPVYWFAYTAAGARVCFAEAIRSA